MSDIFFHEKSKRLLLDLSSSGKKNVSVISKDIDCTYAHTFNLLKVMERQGIVQSKKEGRTKLISLTKRGSELAGIMQNFESLLKEKKLKPPGKKSGAKKKRMEGSPSAGRLQEYASSIEELLKGTRKQVNAEERAKKARLAGRYRALVHKLRPKDSEGKELKENALAMLEEVSTNLSAGGD